MVSVVSRAVAMIALCLACGLQWFFLQSIAWSAMVVANTRQHSFCEAVKNTFDGSHPCDLCKRLNKASDAEKKQQGSTNHQATDLICITRQITLLPRINPLYYPGLDFNQSEVSYQPLSPPPRLAWA